MLGPYEVDVLLGAGGRGEVYRARDTRLGRTVAIKVLLSGLTAGSERRARFAEMTLASRLLNTKKARGAMPRASRTASRLVTGGC